MKLHLFHLFARWSLALAAALSLSACAVGYLLDNEVQTFSGLTALPAEPTYRFERLPSHLEATQAQMEAMAEGALAKVGLRRDDANARLSVLISGQVQRVLSPWAQSWGGWAGVGWGYRSARIGLGMPFGRMESPWYQRDVSIIIRELPSHRVVYETRATNAGPWMDSGTVFPVIFDAAMEGFPAPPPGPRRVDIRVGH